MNDITLRRIQPRDEAALAALWRACFGDSDGFIAAFLAAINTLGGGVAAEIDGRVVGAAYALCAQTLRTPDGATARVGYIYGVGVDSSCRSRGIGRAVTRAARDLALDLGAEIISTLPASPGLYAWYEDVLGVQRRLCRRCTRLDSAPGVPVAPISGADYLARREAICAALPHLTLTPAAIEFEAAFLAEYGGGLYSVGGNAVAAAYVEDGRAVVRELLGAPSGMSRQYAAAVGAALGAATCELWRECAPVGAPDAALDEDGGDITEDYIAADHPLPDGIIWGVSFD